MINMFNSDDGPGLVYRFVFFFYEKFDDLAHWLGGLLVRITGSDKL